MFKRIIKLYLIAAKMDLAWILRDTKYALLAFCADILLNISMVTGIFLIAVRFDGIGDMNKYEVLFMLSYVTIITGAFILFCAGNNGHISRIIGRGQLDHMFIQPLPLKVQLLTSGFIPFSGSSNLIAGIGIMIISIKNLTISITWWWILSLIAQILITMIIIVALSYLFSSIAFYAPVQAEEISSYIIDSTGYISTFPLSGMPFYLQIPLMTIMPTGLMAWFPSLVLLKKTPLNLPNTYPLLIAAIFMILASFFFRRGLNHYIKRGANRYVPYGYRR